ncbi:urease accessory protein [Halomicrobium zhouii]|uniref:Urease accessory protein n=1 Tax=Halomicrobium zhouii TaxID=767519 RepID=A0A1I6K7B9_9EURY|nr:urease accessory protein UreE [Halomicrobium zhouii]SFR87086.1 urease accessory protein [Halomicrobium zhouii]
MLVADSYVGNVDEDPELADRLESEDALAITVDETERRRSRFRTTADDGTDLGVVLGRELRAGDLLSADGRLVHISLEPVAAMVVDLGGVDPDASAVSTALELGHAVGNRHWDLAVEGERAYLPLADVRERMEAEVEPHLPDGTTVGYDEVSPALFDDGDAGHGSDEGGHAHSHGDGGHDHAHGDGSHTHSHGVGEIDSEGSS